MGRSGSTILAAETTSGDATSREATDDQEVESGGEGVASQNKLLMSPAETLALAVFGFVHSATLLGHAIGRSHNHQDSQVAPRANVFDSVQTQSGGYQRQLGEEESTSKEDQVQLLRMRTKRQEVIIYPDTKYLCCVVQAAGKQTNGLT